MSITRSLPMRETHSVTLTARQWREQVLSFATHRGWLTQYTHFTVAIATGFPAVCLVRSIHGGDRRIVFAQLSSDTSKLSAGQRHWLHGLNEVAAASGGCIEVHHWRPENWPLVRKTLI